jgi:peptidoglycan hydrolase-like protein with peptidoglycan-binding domain
MQLTRLAIAVGAAFALATPAFAAGDMHRDRSAQGMHSEMHASSTVRDAQQALQDKGHDVGPIDGVFGPKTSAALRDFQSAQGLKVTGQLDRETMSALNVRSTGMSGTSPSPTSGSSSGPTVSSDAKSPSPASTESGKTSPAASGTAPATASPPASTSRSIPGGMGGPASSGMSGSASTDSTSPSPSSTQSGKAGGG